MSPNPYSFLGARAPRGAAAIALHSAMWVKDRGSRTAPTSSAFQRPQVTTPGEAKTEKAVISATVSLPSSK
jgi:hypothetical protein